MTTEAPSILYSEDKAIEIASYFTMRAKLSKIEVSGKSLSQLLYFLERSFYKEYGVGVLYAQLVSTIQGPALKQVEDELLVEGEKREKIYAGIHRAYFVCEAELDLMGKVWNSFVQLGAQSWQDKMKSLPEWSQHHQIGAPICLESLFESLGLKEEEAQLRIKVILDQAHVERCFQEN